MNQMPLIFRRWSRSAAVCAALAVGTSALADSLKYGDFPLVDGVTLIGVENGSLKFRAPAGERIVALEDIKELTIDSVPQFAAGKNALAAGQLRAAQKAFEEVWSQSRTDWIKHYAGYYLVQVYDARKLPVEASQAYATLASQKADMYFLSKPPIASLAEADESQKKRIADEVTAIVKQLPEAHRKVMENYLAAVTGGKVELPPDKATDLNSGNAELNALKSKSKVILPNMIWSLVGRKGEPADKWESVRLLSAGEYEKALAEIKNKIETPGELPEKLFIMGKAQLALADAKNDPDLYRDAGLTFMRIVVHYSRGSSPHKLVVPAKLEVAYIHKQIGRTEIYDKLLEDVFLQIDDDQTYPEYRLRYYQILGEEPPKPEEPQP